MKIRTLLLAALSPFILISCNKKEEPPDSKEAAKKQNDSNVAIANIATDAKFAVEAADGGMMEVKLGQLAQQNGSHNDVKFFGKSMQEDHTKAENELEDIAKGKSIMLPMNLSEKNEKTYDDLAKLKG